MTDTRATILVCDDDRLVLATLVHGLKSAGYDVVEADNGDDAILLARERRPDLALLDMRMNGKTGLDVAAYLRDHVGTPFMFLSAFNDERIVRQAVEFGALAYLVKPLDVRQIVPAVRAALARWEELRATPVVAPESSGTPGRDECIALGILMERLRIDYDRALEALRAQARAEGMNVAQLAANMVEAANRLNSIPR